MKSALSAPSFSHKGKGKRTAVAVGGGAGLGALIGGLAGGGKGAAIGAALERVRARPARPFTGRRTSFFRGNCLASNSQNRSRSRANTAKLIRPGDFSSPGRFFIEIVFYFCGIFRFAALEPSSPAPSTPSSPALPPPVLLRETICAHAKTAVSPFRDSDSTMTVAKNSMDKNRALVSTMGMPESPYLAKHTLFSPNPPSNSAIRAGVEHLKKPG